MKGGEEAKECDPNFTSNIIQENQHFHLAPSFKVWVLHEQTHVLGITHWNSLQTNRMKMTVAQNHLHAVHTLSIHLYVRRSL